MVWHSYTYGESTLRVQSDGNVVVSGFSIAAGTVALFGIGSGG